MAASGSSVSRILSASSSSTSSTSTGTTASGVVSAQVAVDQLQRAVGQLASQQRVGVADLGQHAAQGVLLRRGWSANCGIGPQVGGTHAAKFFDAVADVHGRVEVSVGGREWYDMLSGEPKLVH